MLPPLIQETLLELYILGFLADAEEDIDVIITRIFHFLHSLNEL